MKYSIVAMILLLALTNCRQDQPDGFHYLTAGDASGKLMKEDHFWELIERSGASQDYELQIGTLENILKSLSAEEIVKFDNTFRALLAASYDYRLWGASYVINGGCSDDCFDYFREYLIAHGRDKFYATLKDPDSCAGWIKTEEEENWEGFGSCAMNAYQKKTGEDLPYDYLPVSELKGKRFDEKTVEQQYPMLTAKFMAE
jgi:hypothetical protein